MEICVGQFTLGNSKGIGKEYKVQAVKTMLTNSLVSVPKTDVKPLRLTHVLVEHFSLPMLGLTQ